MKIDIPLTSSGTKGTSLYCGSTNLLSHATNTHKYTKSLTWNLNYTQNQKQNKAAISHIISTSEH